MTHAAEPRHAIVPESAAGRRLDAVLADLFPEYSRSRLSAWIKTGDVSVDGAPASCIASTRTPAA
jgi:23S rRNA pseudouridine1911/1915/1917 synthase